MIQIKADDMAERLTRFQGKVLQTVYEDTDSTAARKARVEFKQQIVDMFESLITITRV